MSYMLLWNTALTAMVLVHVLVYTARTWHWHKRIRLGLGRVWLYGGRWSPEINGFLESRILFTLIPIWMYPRHWIVYYQGYRNCGPYQEVLAYTKSGAVTKLKSLYPEETLDFETAVWEYQT